MKHPQGPNATTSSPSRPSSRRSARKGLRRLIFSLLLGFGLSACAPVGRIADPPLEAQACSAPRYAAAARYNHAAETNLEITLFGRPEQGWRIYAPQAGAFLKTSCPPESEGFAAALARYQERSGLPGTGALDAPTLQMLKGDWQGLRPFVLGRVGGVCPEAPEAGRLEALSPEESVEGRPLMVDKDALRAFRRMRAQALRDLKLPPETPILQIFSAYRSPESDAARCAREGNCQGVVRAACSAHRTGLALDLDLGALPGRSIDSSADDNRLYQSQTPAYLWLVAHAAEYGYRNYVFEPWHWEWTGGAPAAGPPPPGGASPP